MARSTSLRCAQERDPADLREVHPHRVVVGAAHRVPAGRRQGRIGPHPALRVLFRVLDDLDAFVLEDPLDVGQELLDLLRGELDLGQATEHVLRGEEPTLAPLGREGLNRFVAGVFEADGLPRLGRGISRPRGRMPAEFLTRLSVPDAETLGASLPAGLGTLPTIASAPPLGPAVHDSRRCWHTRGRGNGLL